MRHPEENLDPATRAAIRRARIKVWDVRTMCSVCSDPLPELHPLQVSVEPASTQSPRRYVYVCTVCVALMAEVAGRSTT